jgi:hypothetical protein
MGNSFLQSASRQVVDVRSFLRDSAGGNSIKYSAESGAKHQIYIPYITKQVINEDGTTALVKELVAIYGNVHEWTNPDGKYKASVCIRDVIRKSEDGTLLNDGTCAFCNRISDAWDIYRYRKEQEEAICQLTGDARKTHMEKTLGTFADERKSKEARSYMYILVVKFRTDAQGKEVLADNGLPEYELKVMKLSSSRVEKITQQLENAGTELVGSEIIFGYPKNEDRRIVVSQSTTSPVFPDSRFTNKYTALVEAINADVAKFQWDGIEKAFPEWSGMTSIEAKTVTDNLFEKWDEYKKDLLANPTVKYLEYVTSTPTSTPDINMGVVPQIPNIPTVGAAPVMPGVADTPVMPGVAGAVPGMVPGAAPVIPGVAPTVDPNAVFAGVTPAAPSV